tara:strand:- start:388 stop:840 length:453 start_codon:yes stop_codon:yes gene_type:complete
MINKISFKTKIGWISAFAKEDKIFRIQFGKIKFKNDKNKVLNNFKKNSLKFYLNKIKKIEAKCKIESSIIQKKVWSELRKIKAGHTKTYGEIGKKLKISPRYVGKICGQNKLPLYIPCHRVIRSDGTLGGFTAKGGINLKKKLLNFEKSV